VLARELTFEEVHDVTAAAGIETEVFVHGALCYSYSGLCLFSSQTLGRSGNRGKCAYSCRDSFTVHGAPDTLRDGSATRRDPAEGFPFSMKDLALPDHLPALRAAGVSCFKVEGRKKSPLYVATTTDYYRKLLDGGLSDEERAGHEADMQSVFSRPWTRLFVQSHKDKEVADRDTVGHRGTPVGEVEAVTPTQPCPRGGRAGWGSARVRFRTARALERHDGLQVDLPVLGKPFGFPVDRLWLYGPGGKGKAHEVIQAPAGATVEVGLPAGHPPLPVGARVYCSSSQDVKRRYRHSRPKLGLYRTRRSVRVEAVLDDQELAVTGTVLPRRPQEQPLTVRRMLAGPFAPARDTTAMADAARVAFEKWGDTDFELASFTFTNSARRFVPISRLNQVRRDLAEGMSAAVRAAVANRVSAACGLARATAKPQAPRPHAFRWSLKIDRVAFVDEFQPADWDGVDELTVDIARDHPTRLADKLECLSAMLGRDRIRLALPPLTRKWEDHGLRLKIARFRADGWAKWEAANLSAWDYLGLDPAGLTGAIDLTTDWSVYVVNRAAARQLLDMGVSRFTLSPEDGLENLRSLLAEFGPRAAVIVYQDTPLFLAESCAYANLIGGCPGKANCRFERMEMESSHGERVTALDYHCRTIVLNQGPFCLSPRLKDLAAAGAVSLRADFVYRPYDPAVVRERWRLVRSSRPVPGGHAANFDRGMQ
jgi:putative protease